MFLFFRLRKPKVSTEKDDKLHQAGASTGTGCEYRRPAFLFHESPIEFRHELCVALNTYYLYTWLQKFYLDSYGACIKNIFDR